MKLKELSVKEALLILADRYPEPVEGWFWTDNKKDMKKGKMDVCTNAEYNFERLYSEILYKHFAIEVPDIYRYMTQQECINWLCLLGYSGYQAKYKNEDIWDYPSGINFAECNIPLLEYRTIQEIDGKVVYGEPQEFKIKVGE